MSHEKYNKCILAFILIILSSLCSIPVLALEYIELLQSPGMIALIIFIVGVIGFIVFAVIRSRRVPHIAAEVTQEQDLTRMARDYTKVLHDMQRLDTFNAQKEDLVSQKEVKAEFLDKLAKGAVGPEEKERFQRFAKDIVTKATVAMRPNKGFTINIGFLINILKKIQETSFDKKGAVESYLESREGVDQEFIANIMSLRRLTIGIEHQPKADAEKTVRKALVMLHFKEKRIETAEELKTIQTQLFSLTESQSLDVKSMISDSETEMTDLQALAKKVSESYGEQQGKPVVEKIAKAKGFFKKFRKDAVSLSDNLEDQKHILREQLATLRTKLSALRADSAVSVHEATSLLPHVRAYKEKREGEKKLIEDLKQSMHNATAAKRDIDPSMESINRRSPLDTGRMFFEQDSRLIAEKKIMGHLTIESNFKIRRGLGMLKPLDAQMEFEFDLNPDKAYTIGAEGCSININDPAMKDKTCQIKTVEIKKEGAIVGINYSLTVVANKNAQEKEQILVNEQPVYEGNERRLNRDDVIRLSSNTKMTFNLLEL